MQFAYKTVARILGSTAMSTALLCPISAFADPYTATDGAAHRDASGTESTFSGNTVTAATSGPNKRAWGILVYENVSGEDTTVTVSDTTVTTTGDRAHGIQSGANGSSPTGEDLSRIVLGANVSVETTGNKSFGLHAVDGTSIEGAVMIETSGSEGLGALAETYSTITLTGGSITTTGAAAHGLRASNDVLGEVGGTIIATDVDISTAAAWTFGAYATDGSTITVNGGTITTAGERAYGLLADDDSTINSSAVITTSGLNAHGAQTSAQQDAGLTGGAIHFTGGSITTSGTAAYGLHAIGRGAIDGTVNVTTSGAYSFGAQAETNSTITLTGSQIKTSGANAAGLVANNDFAGTGGIITVTDTVIETTGATAPGAFVSAGGKIAITGGSISASGDDSPALAIFGTGTITLQDVTLTSVDAPTAYVQLTGATDLASLTFGAGTVATANNGTLVQVARTGNGADGTLQLTLADGSNTKGNIIDTDPKGTGKTLLTIGAAAQFEGRVDGVAGVTAQPGSTVDFAPGTNIAGDLTGDDTTFGFSPAGGTIGGDLNLNNGSSLSGGSLGGVPDAPQPPLPPSITPALEDLIPPAANLIVVQGNATVDEESKLGGNVVIGGDLNLQGIGSPGNSIGLVVVGGNATFGADSVYEVEIDGAGHADRIAAGGIATLEGGAVTVTALDLSKSYKQAQTYTILSAEGGVDGTFGSLSTSSVFLKTSLAYTANTVDLTVSIPANAFQSAATSGNQFAAAAALDSLTQSGSSLALYNTIAFQTSLAQARSAFEQLAGDSYASVKTGLIESAHLTTDAINARLRDDVNADGEANTAAWISGFGSWIDHGADSNAGSLKTSTGGVIAGVDVDLSGWRLGLAAGYSQSDLKMKRRSASADSDNVHLGIYTGKKWGPLGLRAGLSHTWHSVDLDRSVAFAGFNGSFESDYKARTLQAFGELSYDIALGSASLTPFGGLTHVSLHSKSFSEDGGLGALNVKSGTTSTTFTSLGLRASAPLKVGGNGASLRGALGWRHAFGDIVPESVQAFTGSSAFSVDGVAIAKDAVLVEAGFDIALSKGSTFGLGYFGQFGDGTSQNGVNARIKFSF